MPESATDRLAHTLRRLDDTEPLIHAYVHLDHAGALAAAQHVDDGALVGPLAGHTFAVKEVVSVAGLPAAGGCRAFAGHIADSDATVVARLRRAGAVLVGTQASHELTCGLDEPPTRNPWALERYPGGSSAGAGASVAVGSATFTLGTDAAGSVRIPAAMCGVVGFKPTAGLVSTNGVVRHATAPSIDNLGVVARTVAETSAVLEVIAGADPADAATLWSPLGGVSRRLTEAPERLDGVRLGVLGPATRAALHERTTPESDVWEAFNVACDDLQRLGAEIVPVEVSLLASAPEAVVTFFGTELAAAHRRHLEDRSADYHPAVCEMLAQALATPPNRVAEAVDLRGRLRAEVLGVFADAALDVLVTPTTPRVAMPLASFDPGSELGTLIPYTCPFNLTGQPALSTPCGFAASGMPIGLQFVGAPLADSAVLATAAAYQSATTWHTHEPEVP